MTEIPNIRLIDPKDADRDIIDQVLALRAEISRTIGSANKIINDMEHDFKEMCGSRNYWFSAYYEQEMKLKYYELVLSKIANGEVEPVELAKYALFKHWGKLPKQKG